MQKSLSKYGWWVIAALLLAGGLALLAAPGEVTLSLTEGQIQDRINSRLDRDFPIRGPAQALVKSVRVESAKIQIHDGRIEFLADATGALRNGNSFNLTIFALGSPRYDDGAFFFEPEQIEARNLSFSGATPADLIARFAERRGLRASSEQIQEGNAKRMLELLAPMARGLAKEIIAHRPIYRLGDDAKGVIVKSLLQSVKIVDDRLLITFSLARLGGPATLGVFCMAAAVALAAAQLLRRGTAS